MAAKTINDLTAIAAAGVATNDQSVLWDTSAAVSVKLPMTDVLQAALNNTSTGFAPTPSIPTTLAADTNNYAPGSATSQFWSSSAAVNITGVVAGNYGETRWVRNVNTNTFAITLKNESASSTAANRMTCVGGADIVLGPSEVALMQYDTTTSRWYVGKQRSDVGEGTLVVRLPGGTAGTDELRVIAGTTTSFYSGTSTVNSVQMAGASVFSNANGFTCTLSSSAGGGAISTNSGPLVITAASGVITTSTTWPQNTPGSLILASNFTQATATLTATNFTWALKAGRSYKITGQLIASNTLAADGAQFSFTGDGTVTATRTRVVANNLGSNIAGTTVATALGGVFNYTTTTGTDDIILSGSFVCGVAGVVTLKAAGNTAVSGTMTLSAGSWVEFTDMLSV